MKVLFFDSYLEDSQNGGNLGIVRNLQMVKSIFGEKNVYECKLHLPSKSTRLKNFILDQSYYKHPINDTIIGEAQKVGVFDIIFLNGPLIYKYVEPFLSHDTQVYLYCHNVDFDYYWNKYILSRSPADYIMAKYIKRMERYIVKKANLISTLNKRDSKRLKKWYGREADFLLPIAMDSLDKLEVLPDETDIPPYGLFVGSSISPNIEGLAWFFKNVAPFTPNIEYQIVGSCCEYFQSKQLPKNINLLGRVNDLSMIYKNASFVICPIFSGSGMKTKTIEALQHGKTIIGTHEAFEGININFEAVGLRSDNAADMISKIKNLNLLQKLNNESLMVFKENFSTDVIYEKFRNEFGQFKT